LSKLTYSQLEGEWIQAGGQASLAPLMAAIALAESGGQTNSLNPNDNHGTQSSYGLWQISTGTHKEPDPNWADPVTNAKLAIGKLKSQGLAAWGTYSSGAYKPFLKNGVPPTSVGVGTTPVSDPTTAGDTFDSVDCAWQMKLPVAGQTCIATKVQVRAIVGVLLLGGGVVVGVFGVIAVAALSFKKAPTAVLGGLAR
jgi:hypothetical protein